MKLLARSFIFFIIFFLFALFVPISFAATTSFRSAGIVTTDGSTPYADLNNCSVTDGLTCNRASSIGTSNLNFKDFGTYSDFGIPAGSTISKIRIKVTGKTNINPPPYVGATISVIDQWPFTWNNCQYPSDLWTLWYLRNNNITTVNFTSNVIYQGIVTQAINGYCLSSLNMNNKRLILRINGSSQSSWSANIDNFEIAFDYDPPATPTPTPSPTPTPTATPTPTVTPTLTPTPILKTPLILIPGIGGSELKVNEEKMWIDDDGHGGMFSHLYPVGEKVWINKLQAGLPGEDDYFDVLRMEIDGKTSKTTLELTGTLFDSYSDAINFFISQDYTLNQDLFVFPYDWRKDISGTKNFLDDAIQQIKSQTGSSKVDIVAHSMGGLVARNYIADVSKASNVRKLFTLGTPYLGSVDALKGIKYGNCLTGKYLNILPLCIGLTNSEIKDVLQNMISSYELIPSRKYFDFYSNEDNQHPYPYRTEDRGLNYNQIKDLLTGFNHNTSLFTPAETFHNLDGLLSNTNGVDVILIAGSGKNTLGQIIEENSHKDVAYINGDGTVPLMSASLVDYSKSLILLGDAKVFYTNQDHGGLVGSGPALNLVKNILEGNDQLPSGVSTSPYSLPLVWWLFSKHSPVDMNTYDSSGNRTGPTANGFEANIPGSSYDTLDDEAFIFIPDNGTYNVKFEATDNGSFDFRIRKFENENASQEVLYDDVPLTTSTKAELTFNTSSSQNPIMYVDEDGNGTTDKEVNSYTSPNPTSTPTPTPTPQPTLTPTVSPTISLASQEKSPTLEEYSEYPAISGVKEVAGAKTFASATKNKEKKMNETRLVTILTSMGGLVAAIYLMKFRKK